MTTQRIVNIVYTTRMKNEELSAGKSEYSPELAQARILSIILLSIYRDILGVETLYDEEKQQAACQSISIGEGSSFNPENATLTFQEKQSRQGKIIHAYLEETAHLAHSVVNPEITALIANDETASEKDRFKRIV